MSLASLSSTAESNIIQSLGALAMDCNDPFCCSGEVDETATVIYNSKGLWNAAKFPNHDEDAMLSGLMDASSFAGFGVGGETVTDVTYRDARKLEPENFLTSIQLSGMSILPLVLKMLVPNMRTIRAELYKLNIYGPGGHFKPHVDTPRSADMFGSLVVCLPTRFTDGSLVLRHRKQEVVYDWSSTPDHPARTIKWAAFFSNIEHEILPVTSGHRVTLTYNLYREGSEMLVPALSLSSPETTAFKRHFIGALSNPHFMRTGGILGFFCQHSYVFESLNDQKLLPSMLKGGDYSIFVDIKSLGIPIVVKPYLRYVIKIWVSLSQLSSVFLFSLRNENESDDHYVLQRFEPFHLRSYAFYDSSDKEISLRLFGSNITRDRKIKWCQTNSHWEPAGAVPAYGNEPYLVAFYQSAAIFVGVPKWGQRRKIIGAAEEGIAMNMEDKIVDGAKEQSVACNCEGNKVIDEKESHSDKDHEVTDGGDMKRDEDDSEDYDRDEDDSEEDYDSDEDGCREEDDDTVFMKIFGETCDNF